uniref:Uncharacterized protein n=1 Tax=Arundo donax TaxID=35708 RepID=A0A0A9D641_ARUDO
MLGKTIVQGYIAKVQSFKAPRTGAQSIITLNARIRGAVSHCTTEPSTR